MTTYKGRLAFDGSGDDDIFRPETEAGQIVDLDDYLETWYATKGGSGTGPGNKAWGYLRVLNGYNNDFNNAWWNKKLPEGTTNETVTDITDILPENTSYVESLFYTFNKMYSLTCNLDLRGWDVSNVTCAEYVFDKCSAPTINISGWDLSHVTPRSVGSGNYENASLGNCFATTIIADGLKFVCTNRNKQSFFGWGNPTVYKNGAYVYNPTTTVSLRNAKIGNLTCFLSNFQNLTSLDMTNMDTSGATRFYQAFWNCNRLTSIDASSFDTSSVTDMVQTFSRDVNPVSLTTLDLSGWNTSACTDFSKMFNGNTVLTTLGNITFDFSSVTATSRVTQMFNGCTALGSNAVSLKFKNVPSSVFADEAALRSAASIPSGCVVQIENFI